MGCGAGTVAPTSSDTVPEGRPQKSATDQATPGESLKAESAVPAVSSQGYPHLDESLKAVPTVPTVPAVSSTSAPSMESTPDPKASIESDSNAPAFAETLRVLIKGIEKKPELNGQVATIVSYDGGADKKYTVSVNGAFFSLREAKLYELPADYKSSSEDYMDVDTAIAQCSETSAMEAELLATPVGRQPTGESFATRSTGGSFKKSMPLGELTATGRLIPTYHWVEVPGVASLPPGMEVKMPVGGTKCARIPESWRLQIVAEGQVDSYRCDVGRHTPVIDVIIGAAARFGWEMHDLELRAEGAVLELQEDATVGSAALFGRKLTARQHRS